MVILFFRYVCCARCCAGIWCSAISFAWSFRCVAHSKCKMQDIHVVCEMESVISSIAPFFWGYSFCNQFWMTCGFGNLTRNNVSISRNAFHLFVNRSDDSSCEWLCNAIHKQGARIWRLSVAAGKSHPFGGTTNMFIIWIISDISVIYVGTAIEKLPLPERKKNTYKYYLIQRKWNSLPSHTAQHRYHP